MSDKLSGGQSEVDAAVPQRPDLFSEADAATMRLGLEELCRIVDALTVETKAVRGLVGKVQRRSPGGSFTEELAGEAIKKLHLCIGFLGGLREALGETTDAEQRVFTGEGQP